jgi:4'-phosphopantetheinyl transferase
MRNLRPGLSWLLLDLAKPLARRQCAKNKLRPMQCAEIYWSPPPPGWCVAFGSRKVSLAVSEAPSHFTPPPIPEVHVWASSLEVAPETLHSLSALVSPSEQERAAQFRFEQHRNRFVVGRGILRTILGWYLQIDPRALDFAYGENGKPSLAGSLASSGLHFNLAHCQDLALIAVTIAGPLGIDVEQVRLPPDAEQLLARFFSARENVEYGQLTHDQKPAAFFRLWTRKEAWLKATGEGIGSLVAPVHSTLSSAGEGVYVNAVSWTVYDLTPASGFAAALAVAAAEAKVICWRCD